MYAGDNNGVLMPHESAYRHPWADVRVITNPSWWFGSGEWGSPYRERHGGLHDSYISNRYFLGCPSDRLFGSDRVLALAKEQDFGLISYIYRSTYNGDDARKNGENGKYFPIRNNIKMPHAVAIFGGRHHLDVGPGRMDGGAIHKKKNSMCAKGYNVSYLDGHANWVPEPTYYEYTAWILGDPQGGWALPWETNHNGTNAWKDWDNFMKTGLHW